MLLQRIGRSFQDGVKMVCEVNLQYNNVSSTAANNKRIAKNTTNNVK